MVYATSKFDDGKVNSPLHLPFLKPGTVFKEQRANKFPIHLQDKINRLLDILEQYKIFSPVYKEKSQKKNVNKPRYYFAKGESLKIVLHARYLNSLIDESICNWPKKPIQVTLTKKRTLFYNS